MLPRLRACLLGALIVASGPAWPPASLPQAAGWTGEAMAQTRSSGGYSRPSSRGLGSSRSYGRTPSYRGPVVVPRTPSTSGGYGRPAGPPAGGTGRRPSTDLRPGGSAWDRGYSQRQSAEALDRMRQQRAPVPQPTPQPVPQPAPGVGGGAQPDPGWWRRGGTLGGGAPVGRNGGWYRDRGWSPGGVPGVGSSFGQRSFGLWDGVFLWFLLNNLSRPGATDFFHNHRDDPGYREFRGEAERRAQEDPALRQRLDQLDRQLADRQDQPRDPTYLPPEVPPDVALAPRDDARTPTTGAAAEDGGGFGLIWPVVLVGGGLLLFRMRRQRAARPAPGPAGTGGAAGRGDAAGGGGAAGPGGDFSVAPAFRVGMTVTCDPTPFLLAGDVLKAPPPAAGRTSIEAVGRIREGQEELTRLYLPGQRSFLQIYVDPSGTIQDCRYFAIIDEVVPADEAEWALWLAPQEGMIGWPEFQTRDGRTYARHWAPGPGPVEPRAMPEAIEELGGTRQRQAQAMLYAAPTGAAAPAPQVEYILVAAVEEAGRAWVEIRAGIDINPASLALA
jgi:hypothetical protein